MRKFKKLYSLVVIFMLTGVCLCANAYCLRAPMDGHKNVRKALENTGQETIPEEHTGINDDNTNDGWEKGADHSRIMSIIDALPLIRAMGGLLYEKRIAELIDRIDDYSTTPSVQVEIALLAAKLTDDGRKLEVIEKYLNPYISYNRSNLKGDRAKPALEAIIRIALTMSDNHKKDICDKFILPRYQSGITSTTSFLLAFAEIVTNIKDNSWKKEKIRHFSGLMSLLNSTKAPRPEIPYIIRIIAPTLESASDSYKSDIIYGTGGFTVGLKDLTHKSHWLSTRGEAVEAIGKIAGTFAQDTGGDALKIAIINDILAYEFSNADDFNISNDTANAIADIASTLTTESYNEKIKIIYNLLMKPDEKGIIYGGAQPAVARITSTLSDDDAKDVIKDILLPMFLQNLPDFKDQGLFRGDARESASAIAKISISLKLDKDKLVYIEEFKKALLDSDNDYQIRLSCIDAIATITATLATDALKLDTISFLKKFDIDDEVWDVRENSWRAVGEIGLTLNSEEEKMALISDFKTLRTEQNFANYCRSVYYISELAQRLTKDKNKKDVIITVMKDIVTDTEENFNERMLVAETMATMTKTLQATEDQFYLLLPSVSDIAEGGKDSKTGL